MKYKHVNIFNIGIDLLSFFFVVINIFCVISCYVDLPNKIITHYNLGGMPDRYGDKSSIFLLTIVNVVIYVICSILEKRPDIFNYPVKVTKYNKEKLHLYGTRMLKLIKLCFNAILFYISFSIIQNTSIGILSIGIFIIVPSAILIYYIRKMRLTDK